MKMSLRYILLFVGVLLGTQWLGLMAKQFDADVDVVMAATSPVPTVNAGNNLTDLASPSQARVNHGRLDQRTPGPIDDNTAGYAGLWTIGGVLFGSQNNGGTGCAPSTNVALTIQGGTALTKATINAATNSS